MTLLRIIHKKVKYSKYAFLYLSSTFLIYQNFIFYKHFHSNNNILRNNLTKI